MNVLSKNLSTHRRPDKILSVLQLCKKSLATQTKL